MTYRIEPQTGTAFTLRRGDTLRVIDPTGEQVADLIAFDGFNGRPGGLTVVAPEMRLHSRCDFADHRLGHEVELFPVAVLPPRQ